VPGKYVRSWDVGGPKQGVQVSHDVAGGGARSLRLQGPLGWS
jgi:hypothetical protein